VRRAGLEPATNGLEISRTRPYPKSLNHVGQQWNQALDRSCWGVLIPADSRSLSTNKRQAKIRKRATQRKSPLVEDDGATGYKCAPTTKL
jgi:hypothetical protein